MKCQHCNNKVEMKEVKSIKYTCCCGDIQVDPLSLRPKVQESIKEEKEFYEKLKIELVNVIIRLHY